MALDTLAYAKHLEHAGIERPHAEALAEAMNAHVLPDLATRPDLENLRRDLVAAMHQIQLQSIGIFAVLLGVLFAFIKLT
jgi:hypothetical protein